MWFFSFYKTLNTTFIIYSDLKTTQYLRSDDIITHTPVCIPSNQVLVYSTWYKRGIHVYLLKVFSS